ncbi:MAG: 2-amino-4-hydroxy-6-hydroxymethyldihydropteridine diphosphokinase [Breznakibacter sp.]
MENSVVISIGSNIKPSHNITKALDLLSGRVMITARAPHLVTKPIGITDQPDFVNTMVRVITDLAMPELKVFLREVENRVGRDRSRPKFGPREVDLDVLEWNGAIVDDDYYERPFLQKLYSELVEGA